MNGISKGIVDENWSKRSREKKQKLKKSRWARGRNKRRSIYKRDKNRCVYCGNTNKKELTIEHLYPVSMGGMSCQENLVTSCLKCNKARGTKPVAVFMKELEEAKNGR